MSSKHQSFTMRRASFVAVVLPVLLVIAMQLLHFQVHGFLVYPSLTPRAGRWSSLLWAEKEPYNEDSNNSLGGALSPPPPFTNPKDLAVNIFSHPWFSTEEGAETLFETKRRQVFGDKTIQEFREEFLEIGSSKFIGILLATKVEMKRVKEYFEMLDIGTRQQCAEEILIGKFGGKFKTIDIDIGSSLDGLLPGAPKDTRILDLRFLDDLRLPKDEEKFLSPEKIYVRNCMRQIFGLFVEDVTETAEGGKMLPDTRTTAFIGSPGVGKSILSFCAALYQAQTTNVIYYRRTKSLSEQASVFVMTPGKSAGKVRVWFNREIELGGIDAYRIELQRFVIRRKEYYAFVDGPRFDDKENTLSGKYDYLCTSGGMPGYKDEEVGKRLWILDGWKSGDALHALKMYGFTKKKCKEAYEICGGNIRKMLEVCLKGRAEFESRLENQLKRLDKSKLKLVLEDSAREGSGPDSLRTMFRSRSSKSTSNVTMIPVQFVDSPFVLNEIRSELDLESLLSGYIEAKNLGLISSQAAYFEAIVHKWVKMYMPTPLVQKVCYSKGSLKKGLSQLSQANKYWIPSVSNFPAIDAAMVVNNTLVGFQMTISKRKNTDELRTNFKSKALPLFRAKFPNLTQAVVYIVAPAGTSFKCPDSDDAGDGFVIKYETHEVDLIGRGLTTTMQSLFERIQPGNKLGTHLQVLQQVLVDNSLKTSDM